MNFEDNKKQYEDFLVKTKERNPELFNYSSVANDSKKRYWKNIPVDVMFLKPLYNCVATKTSFFKKSEKKSLIDLGSGTGNVLLFAKNLGLDVTGVEIDPRFNAITSDYKIINDNFLNLTDDLQNYDIIYSFLPLKDKSEFLKFIDKVAVVMKKDAFLCTPMVNNKNELLIRKGLFLYQKK